MYNLKSSSVGPVPRQSMVLEKVGDLNPTILEEILQHSLSNPAIHVTNVQSPRGHAGINDQWGSELAKIVVTLEEDGNPRKLHLIIKEALESGLFAWWGRIFGLFPFSREVFFFNTALPDLLRVVSVEQAAALAEIMPKVHYAHSNYQQEDSHGCFLTRPMERGIILMKNLKEGNGDNYVDMKEIECTSGGGVKSVHMRMLLKAMAHFHGAWMVWLRKNDGMGDMTRDQLMKFFKQHKPYNPQSTIHMWFQKYFLKNFMSNYTALAESKNLPMTKERIQQFINSPQSIDHLMKVFDFHDSKFKTMCHSDLRTTQIMFSLNKDGKYD